MTAPYLIRTLPAFRDYLWGGRNLHDVLGKTLPNDGIWAESWEIVDHHEHQSVVANGAFAGQSLRDLARSERQWLLGNAPPPLPLLLKYLDCQRVLSVQVHPDDAYAAKMNPPDLGKTEAWYIISAQPGAVLYAGLRAGVTRKSLARAIAEDTVEQCLHVITPQAGDCVFIPAGTVHALGAGLLVAEIQQASNTTFRLFDWNRVDNQGKRRELHIDQSLEVIDYQRGPMSIQSAHEIAPGRERLVTCDKFCLERLTGESRPVLGDARFHYLTAPYGGAAISTGGEVVHLARGESLLAPAAMAQCLANVAPQAVLLDMYLL